MFYGLMPEIKMDWIGLDWLLVSLADRLMHVCVRLLAYHTV